MPLGEHVLITFPVLHPSGIYQVRLNGAALAADTVAVVELYGASSIRASLTADLYVAEGNTAVLTAAVLDEQPPVPGATAELTVVAEKNLSSFAQVMNYLLVRGDNLPDSGVRYHYKANVFNGRGSGKKRGSIRKQFFCVTQRGRFGAIAVFSPTSRTSSGGTTLTVKTTASVRAGAYPLVITATGDGLTATMTLTLVVKLLTR